jgi:hypothetical protein
MLLAILFFVAFWVFISFLTSFISGWYLLSKRFRAQSEPYGVTRSAGPFFSNVYMRYWQHYGGVIRLTAADDALYISAVFLIRIGHPPLCIPWKEIQFGSLKRWWRSYVVLTLGNQEQVPLRIPERMARKLGLLERIPAGS